MTVIQVGFLIRMLMLSNLYMKVNDWIFDTNVNIDIMTVRQVGFLIRMLIFNLIQMLMIDIMTVRQVGFLIRMLILI